MSLNQFSQLRQRIQAKHSAEKKNHKKWRRQICESISNLRPGWPTSFSLGSLSVPLDIGHWPGFSLLCRAINFYCVPVCHLRWTEDIRAGGLYSRTMPQKSPLLIAISGLGLRTEATGQ